jgi:HD-GYP domain-containing protein (c-di-GMP phosphodiesterase class II)
VGLSATMIRKVKVDQLRPGAYVADFNCSWLAHPFLTSRKRIKSYKDVEKIKRSGITEVYIDTTKGIDIRETLTREEFLREFESRLDGFVPGKELDLQVQVSLQQELKRAREIQTNAHSILKKAYNDIRYGEKIKLEEFSTLVENVIDSVTRNRDALLLLSTIKEKDAYTYEHSFNVGILTAGLSKALMMDKDEIFEYTLGSMLHDIGKSKIPEEILKKEGGLSPKEYNVLKKHVQYGIELLSGMEDVSAHTLSVVAEHHERLNGTGYPNRLTGDQISLGGKLGAIIDVYDALTSDRIYHTALNPVQALKEIYTQRQILFDEGLLEQFIKFMGIYPPGTLVRLESGFLAIVIESGRENILQPVVRLVYDLNKSMPIVPRNLDLSKGVGELHRIIETVNPATYNIKVTDYLLEIIPD